MDKLKTIRFLMDEFGQMLKSGMTGDFLYYSAHWDEIQEQAYKEAKGQYLQTPQDVRCADYALDLLGIPHQRVEAGQDEKGNWIVYWR